MLPASSRRLASDACIFALAACVVVAVPWSIYPIAHNIIQHNQLPNTTAAIFKKTLSFDHLIGLKG
jgi:hypothetical protein